MVADKELLYDLKDVAIVPIDNSDMYSKSAISVLTKDDKFPIFMFADKESYKTVQKDNYTAILRVDSTTSIEEKLSLMYDVFVPFTFEEFYRFIANRESRVKISDSPFYIVLDMLSCYRKNVIDAIALAKKDFAKQLTIIVSGVLSAPAYNALSNAGTDYVIIGSNRKLLKEMGMTIPYGSLIEECVCNRASTSVGDMPMAIREEDAVDDVERPKRADTKLIIAGLEDVTSNVKAMAMGANYVLLKDYDIANRFLNTLKEVMFVANTATLDSFSSVEIRMVSQEVSDR